MSSYVVGCFKGIRHPTKQPEYIRIRFYNTNNSTSERIESSQEFRDICQCIPDSDLNRNRTHIVTSSSGEYFFILKVHLQDILRLRGTQHRFELCTKFVEIWTGRNFENMGIAITELEGMVNACIVNGSLFPKEPLQWR
ncbi:predicted protein [Botrytis cinerea T4]|uniref:Uncharacterized protein n=1 Tax=Botryotinia fuckeliana (strain T4) TaxID=999810 RepID=G2XP62_BOTF4|nr:predicted protein [Botrytis cinerea T4]